jgi:hypothetical protein
MSVRNFKTTGDPQKYGNIKEFKQPISEGHETLYDICEGVFLGYGRRVGEGTNETNTLMIADVETGDLFLLFAHKVLENELDKAYKAEKIADWRKDKDFKPLYVSIKYLGKKLSSSGAKYHNYELKFDDADPMEVAEAEKVLISARGGHWLE